MSKYFLLWRQLHYVTAYDMEWKVLCNRESQGQVDLTPAPNSYVKAKLVGNYWSASVTYKTLAWLSSFHSRETMQLKVQNSIPHYSLLACFPAQWVSMLGTWGTECREVPVCCYGMGWRRHSCLCISFALKIKPCFICSRGSLECRQMCQPSSLLIRISARVKTKQEAAMNFRGCKACKQRQVKKSVLNRVGIFSALIV